MFAPRDSKNVAVVSGATGFLGRYLCKALRDAGWVLIAIDKARIGPGIVCLDLSKEVDILAVITPLLPDKDVARIGAVFNAACPASPPEYQADPIGTLGVCYNGTKAMLEVAKTAGARFIQFSTSEVYGDPEVYPQPETYRGKVNPFGPRACYDEGKRAAEALVWAYIDRYALSAACVRIFNTYGPGMRVDDGRVVTEFFKAAFDGMPMPIHGSGTQNRTFCYVDDLIDGILRVAADDAFCGVINVGGEDTFTIAELACLVREACMKHKPDVGSSMLRAVLDLPEDDPKCRRPDLTLIKEKYGYNPAVSLSEGLARMAAWFAEHYAPASGPM